MGAARLLIDRSRELEKQQPKVYIWNDGEGSSYMVWDLDPPKTSYQSQPPTLIDRNVKQDGQPKHRALNQRHDESPPSHIQVILVLSSSDTPNQLNYHPPLPYRIITPTGFNYAPPALP